jgi:hypothetical protein
LIKDLFRLTKIDLELRADGIFVYLATNAMVRYFSNPNNGLSNLFHLGLGKSIHVSASYLAGRSTTLLRSSGELTPCMVTMLYSRALPNGHELRIFDVRLSAIT